MKYLSYLLFISTCFSDIQSTNGKIRFNIQIGGQAEMILNSTGLGIGMLPSANLSVAGNAIVSDQLFIGGENGSSNLNVNGTISYGFQTVSSNTILGNHSIVLADTSSDNITITLPYAGNVIGRQYQIKKTATSNSVWISGGGSLIDDTSPIELPQSNMASIKLLSDGSQWYVIESKDLSETVASDNLVGWWKLDENSGVTALDSSQLNNDGSLNGAMSFSGNGIVGKIARGLAFDSVNDYISVSDDSSLNLTDNFTISLWHKGSATVLGWDVLIAKEYWNNSEGWVIYRQSTGDVYFSTNSTARIIITDPFLDENWHNLAITIASGTATLYIDGIKMSSATTPITQTTVPLHIGARHQNNGTSYTDPVRGFLDDVRIYNRALTTTEISSIYDL